MAIFGRDRDVLEVGLEAIVVGFVAFAFTLGNSNGLKEIAGFWPETLVVLGGGLLMCPMVQQIRG